MSISPQLKHHRAYRADKRVKLAALKSAKGCAHCPEKNPDCLQFHHRDPLVKTRSINRLYSGTWSWRSILEEIAKCDILCANCHLKLHGKERAVRRGEQVDHPAHYGGDTTYEAIKVIEAWELGFALGNAVKYISRAGKKDPAKELEDLQKARWYLDRRIGQLAAQKIKSHYETKQSPPRRHAVGRSGPQNVLRRNRPKPKVPRP